MKTDNLYIYALMHELPVILEGARLEKIFQPTQYDFIFYLRTKNGNKKLLMSIHPETFRFHLTKQQLKNPERPKNFCVVLRKYLIGGMITRVEQIQHDRIIRLGIDTYNIVGDLIHYNLYIELMGKYSNVVLVDEANQIIDAAKKTHPSENVKRTMLPKIKYQLPDARKREQSEQFYLQPFLQKWLKQHHYDKDVLITAAENPHGYYYKLQDGSAIYAFLPIDQILAIKEVFAYQLLSEAIEAYYHEQSMMQQVKEQTANVSHFVDQIYSKNVKKREKLLQEYKTAKDFEHYQLIGNLLLAAAHTLPAHTSEVILNNYDHAQPQPEQFVVALDAQKTIVQNAQMYFKKYRKLKTAVDQLKKQLAFTDREIAYFEGIRESLRFADLAQALEIIEELQQQGYLKIKNKAKRLKKTPQYAKYVYNDSTYLVGKNNLQNDYVTFKMRRKNYLWLHVKDAPGSHVLLLEKPPHSALAIHIGALLAAYFSKMRVSENVAVDYTLVQHVQKPPGAKPGYVIYKEQKTVYVTPSRTNLQKYFAEFL